MEISFTESELSYIYTLVLENQEEGSYWGRKDYFTKRQEAVIDKIVAVLVEKDLK